MSKQLKAHLIDAGIFKEIVHSAILPDGVVDLLWSLQVSEAQTRALPQRTLWLFKAELSGYQRAPLIEASSIKVGVGLRQGGGSVEIRFVRAENHLGIEGTKWTCQLKGDVSLVLPQTGLLSMAGHRPAAVQRASIRSPGVVRLLRRDLTNTPVLQRADALELPLNNAALEFRGLGSISLSPALDLTNQVFKFGRTGVLMSFENLVFTCQGGKPRFNFAGGKLWAVSGGRA
jgi:hypothetical protein